MKEVTLTPTSYVVLGLISLAGEATPYDLKQMVARAVGHFWSIPHSQLYAEPARLAQARYLVEQRETGGRRRKHYSLTERGRLALEQWTASGTGEEGWELRDPGLLKLFFGADPAALAREQLEVHRRRLADYEAIFEGAGSTPPGPLLALEAGVGHEREYVRFWEQLAAGSQANRRVRGTT